VLVYGDLAKTGKQQVLVANVVPKTPKDSIPGTIVTRAVVAENDDGKWQELFRCDEHLKNAKGYLGMTPIEPVTGWRLQFEQDVVTGLTQAWPPQKAWKTRMCCRLEFAGIRKPSATSHSTDLMNNF
jgi:hypothetical protein